MSAIDWSAFEAWLTAEGFALSTARTKAKDARTYVSDPEAAVEGKSDTRVRQLTRAVELLLEWKPALTKEVPPVPQRERRRRPKPKRRSQLPIDIAEFKLLRAAVAAQAEKDDGPAEILDVLVRYPLRIGDVLRLERTCLETGLRRDDGQCLILVKGGKEVPLRVRGRLEPKWRRLAKRMAAARAPNVAAAVSSSDSALAGDAAYKAVDGRFKTLCAACAVTGEHNLHRLRHTVATHILDLLELEERDVQELLVHDNLQTTRVYTGGKRARDASDRVEAFDALLDQEDEED